MAGEFRGQGSSEVSNYDRRWGLSVLKSVYAEQYPNINIQYIMESAKRVEQKLFAKTNSSSKNYREFVTSTTNSIKVLAAPSARNFTKPGFTQENIGGASRVPIDGVNETSADKNHVRSGMASGSYSFPDASDIVKLVPSILEAGVQVLGKIETAQQVRILDDLKKSTIGFLAYEKLSNPTHSRRGPSSPSGTAHQTLSRNNAPLYERSLKNGVTIPKAQLQRTGLAQSTSEACVVDYPSHGEDTGTLGGFEYFNDWVTNDLQKSNQSHEGTRSNQPMAFAELKAKYGEEIERLHPLVEAQFKQRSGRQEASASNIELRDSIAFVRAGLMQDDITNPGTLRSLENLSIRILHIFGYLLRGKAVSNVKAAENRSDEDVPSNQSLSSHPQDTDESEELGETDSETEDENDVENPGVEQQEESVGDDLVNGSERKGYGADEEDFWSESVTDYEERECTLEEGDIPQGEFIGTFLDEVFAQKQLTSGSAQRNAQKPEEAIEELGMMTSQDTRVTQLEQLLEAIKEENAESSNVFGLEPIPFTENGDSGEDQSSPSKVQVPENTEKKTEEPQAPVSLEERSAPTFTPRRSNRIRTQASAATTQGHLTEQTTTNSLETPHSASEASAKTPRTGKTPRSTPRKTPKKTPKKTPRK